MLDQAQVRKALKKVYDPEIPVNLIDLGLIYDISVDGTVVDIRMTLTAPACPMHALIAKNVKEAIEAMETATTANVTIVWEPRWNPDMISPEGRKALGME